MSETHISDDTYRQAVAIVRINDRASASFVQRELKVGYNIAAAIMQRMEREGIVTAPNHMGKREVLSARSEPK